LTAEILVLPLLSFVAALAIALVATPAFALAARGRGLLAVPREERWSARATPILGGAAITLAVLVVLASLLPDTPVTRVVLIGAALAFVLGLLDDFRRLSPATKLVGQVLIGVLLFVGGVRVEILPVPALSFLATVFWVVALMNAINLSDNMDGLAAGISVIAGVSLGLAALDSGGGAALIGWATAGSALGFLVYNVHPAKIFMGDSGSMVLGLLLASAALVHTTAGATNVALAIFAPLAFLALPIFDTALVTALRRFAGRPIGQGGKDHTSHRLAALGLSESRTVLVLYAVAASFAGLGLVAEGLGQLAWPVTALGAVGLVLFGAFLAEVDVYERGLVRRGVAATEFYAYLRFGAEVLLDVVLICVAYYLAYALRFEGAREELWVPLFTQTLPIVVGAQLGGLVLAGTYRTLWRYFGIADIFVVVRGVTFGTLVAAAILGFGFATVGFSRAAVLLDWILALLLVIGARSFLLWLRYRFAPNAKLAQRRVLILGATEAGAVALRLLSRNGGLYRTIGFLDDDPGKRHRRLAGVPVLGTISELQAISARHNVTLVLCALDSESDEPGHSFVQLRNACNELGIEWSDFLLPVPRLAEQAR
jgi:UDP-GlcNAc:undecaprenyl-phosphate GlcNAc-1-phosphate transferase